MLYEQWRQIARVCPTEIALRDLASGEAWTFAELAALAQTGPSGSSLFAFPQGGSARFILDVLRAWQTHQIVCPLESGQIPPAISGELPSEIVHLKITSGITGKPRLVAFT